jgi:UDP-N-acetylglucosamine 2-epimerase (non-hydrolysing)
MTKTVLVVFGTRPEAIKVFPVVHALRADARFRVVTCVSAQHRGMLDQVLEIAGIVPDHDLDLMRPDQTLDGLTAALLTGLGRVMGRTAGLGGGPGRYRHGHGGRAGRLLPQAAGGACRGRTAQPQHLPSLAGRGEPQDHRFDRGAPFRPTETSAAALHAENVPAERSMSPATP